MPDAQQPPPVLQDVRDKSLARGTGPDGEPMTAVNVRCLDGFALDQFRVAELNGRSR